MIFYHPVLVLVLNKKIVYAVQRFTAQVVGDGVSSVEQLIKKKNALAPAGRQVIQMMTSTGRW